MRDLMERKIRTIWDDFLCSAEAEGTLCELKKFTFERNCLPDYTKALVQQNYLLHYLPAYLTEYYLVFRDVLTTGFIDSPINALSIGAGAGLDHWALHYALLHVRKQLTPIYSYTGIDIVDWLYREQFDNGLAQYTNHDILGLDRFNPATNFVIFPKSIGEFRDEDITPLLYIFRDTPWLNDKIIMISFHRKDRVDIDYARFNAIANVMKHKLGYILLGDPKEIQRWPDDCPLEDAYPNFYYPSDIRDRIDNLLCYCKRYTSNSRIACEPERCDNIERRPITTTKYMVWQAYCFKRSN